MCQGILALGVLLAFLGPGLQCAKMTVLALLCISETSEQNMMKFQTYLTFMKINLLMKKIGL